MPEKKTQTLGVKKSSIRKLKLNKHKARIEAKDRGFRSMFEVRIAEELNDAKVPYEYETLKIKYTREQVYNPDFILPNGIILEVKGKFDSNDRAKHLLIKQQHPELDIRFVFMRASQKLYKGSKSTYAEWADNHGFKYSDKKIPAEWLEEALLEEKKET